MRPISANSNAIKENFLQAQCQRKDLSGKRGFSSPLEGLEDLIGRSAEMQIVEKFPAFLRKSQILAL
jgi:hypothetical protein